VGNNPTTHWQYPGIIFVDHLGGFPHTSLKHFGSFSNMPFPQALCVSASYKAVRPPSDELPLPPARHSIIGHI